jgi:hypothetical protein
MIVLSAAACGGDGGTDLESEGESSIEPITGEWYRPTVATTWQWQLVGTINTGYSVDLYDIDLFDVPTSLIASIQASGKRVICYFSAGSFEDFRSDASSFRAQDLGTPLGDFPDEMVGYPVGECSCDHGSAARPGGPKGMRRRRAGQYGRV